MDKEILIGKTARFDYTVEEGEYFVKLEGDKLIFGGGHYVTVKKAVEIYTRMKYESGKAYTFSGKSDFTAEKLGYSYVWGDEFEAKTLNTTNWSRATKMAATAEMTLDDTELTTKTENGYLKMIAMRHWDPKKAGVEFVAPWSVTTLDTMSYKFGYVEIRAKVPFIRGVWPSFWTSSSGALENKSTYNYSIEVDIFEVFSSLDKLSPNIHKWYADGHLTPEEVVIYAKTQGYDFMAITDHQIYTMESYAPETGVLVIPGMEYGNDLVKGNGFRCFHTVCLGPTKEDGNGFEHDQKFDWGCAPNSEEYQPFLDEAHQKKNLTILCHPQWSSTSAKYFETQKGNFAMEVWNSGGALCGDCDSDAAYWDEILGQGKVWYGVATDDAHTYKELCKGWVMVKAEKNINSILKALENGEFYSSCGPEIYDFYVEDGKAIIDCSPVSRVRLHSDMHPNRVTVDEDGNITHAEFDIENYWAGPYDYVRISIVDKDGKKAWTNPIFL